MRKRSHAKTTNTTRLAIVPEAEPIPASVPALTAPTQDERSERADEREMLTYQGLARVTGIRVNTLYTMVCRGEIPCYRLAPRIVRFSASAIAAWMAGRHQPAREPAGRPACAGCPS